MEGRSLRSSGGLGQGNDDEEEDSDGGGAVGGVGGADEESEEGRDYSWKKTIMIGPSYQATVPSGLSDYDDSLPPYENEDKLLWDPSALSPKRVEEYLAKSQESALSSAGNGNGSGNGGVFVLPSGAHTRDDEQALHLLHQCGNDAEEALRRGRMGSAAKMAETMSLWSEEECRAFELGEGEAGQCWSANTLPDSPALFCSSRSAPVRQGFPRDPAAEGSHPLGGGAGAVLLPVEEDGATRRLRQRHQAREEEVHPASR